MTKFFEELKEYGGLGTTIVAGLIAAAVAYGSATATTASTMSNHETRIVKLEHDNEENGKTIARIDQRVEDIWVKIVPPKN